MKKSGVITRMRALFERNRLGELLVLNGLLTPQELRFALVRNDSLQLAGS